MRVGGLRERARDRESEEGGVLLGSVARGKGGRKGGREVLQDLGVFVRV